MNKNKITFDDMESVIISCFPQTDELRKIIDKLPIPDEIVKEANTMISDLEDKFYSLKNLLLPGEFDYDDIYIEKVSWD